MSDSAIWQFMFALWWEDERGRLQQPLERLERTRFQQWQSWHTCWGSPNVMVLVTLQGQKAHTRKCTEGQICFIKCSISSSSESLSIIFISPELAQMEACLDENPDFFMVSSNSYFSFSFFLHFLHHLIIWFRTTWCEKEAVQWSTSGWPLTQKPPLKTLTLPPQGQPGSLLEHNIRIRCIIHSSNNFAPNPPSLHQQSKPGCFRGCPELHGHRGHGLRLKVQNIPNAPLGRCCLCAFLKKVLHPIYDN